VLLPIVAAALQTDYPDRHAHRYVLAAIIAMPAAAGVLAYVPFARKTLVNVARARAA
jgi:putative exporter of polyketide antibiotics